MEARVGAADVVRNMGSVVPPPRRIGRPTMLAYGFGAVAYGVKDASFGTFVMMFYNQVIGLPAQAVGLVVMLALVLDALIDPAIGFFSDRTQSRWGRRHPWMYASALPIAVGWLFLWNPPGLSEGWTLAWLFVTAVIVRSAVSCYEVPSVALTPELTVDYDERTRIMAYRYVFGWAGGLLMLLAAYGIFLTPAPGQESGLLNRGGYVGFAIAGAIAMVVAILVSALGTHHEIKNLPRPKTERTSLRRGFRELLETANNKAFVILMLAGLCLYTNQGMGYSISNYLYSYVWRFSPASLVALSGVLFVGVLIAFFAAPRLAKRFGKKQTAAGAITIGALMMASPYVLRLAGLFPAPDSPIMPWPLFAIYVCTTACNVSAAMIGASMMADVVEHSEVKTGRRSEGVFFAGAFFIQKCTSGVGLAVTGTIISLAGMSAKLAPGQVPEASLDRLTILFAGTYVALGLAGAALFLCFPFGREEHEARVAALGGRAD